jgi:transcriptional regulator with XRE-family HTH domain
MTSKVQPTSVRKQKRGKSETIANRRLTEFGRLLRNARDRRHFSQSQAAISVNELIHQLGISRRGKGTVSQSLIASYEAGSVFDPHPVILSSLAKLYECDYQEWVIELVREKYAPLGGWPSDLAGARWDLLAATWQQPQIGVPALATDQLKAKSALIRSGVLLTLDGITLWEGKLPPGTSFWILAPDLIAAEFQPIRETVIHNLLKTPPIGYVYFIDPACVDRFRKYQAILRKDPRLQGKGSLVDDKLEAIRLPSKALQWISTDHIVAFPNTPERAEVFRYIRSGDQPLAYRLSPRESDELLKNWKNWEAGAVRISPRTE